MTYEVARELGVPLDVWVVRKLGAPCQPELGMRRITEGLAVLLDPRIVGLGAAFREELMDIAREQQRGLDRRVREFRRGDASPSVHDRTVIVVDDGIATGGTTRAAIQALREQKTKRLVIAVPPAR